MARLALRDSQHTEPSESFLSARPITQQAAKPAQSDSREAERSYTVSCYLTPPLSSDRIAQQTVPFAAQLEELQADGEGRTLPAPPSHRHHTSPPLRAQPPRTTMPTPQKKILFCLAGVLSFVCALGTAAAIGTQLWVKGTILCKTGALLVNATGPELEKFIGEIQYGLFHGERVRQCGLGGRPFQFSCE